MRNSQLIIFALLALFLRAPARAQVTEANPQLTNSPNRELPKKALEKKELGLLEQVLEESASFPSAENRIIVMIEACRLFWPRDQARARTLLGELKQQINAFNTSPIAASRLDLRIKVLEWLAPKDAESALDFLRSTRGEKGSDRYETQLESRLASQVAASNPQLAFQIAQDLLKTNEFAQVVEIWRNLRGADPTLGGKLTDEILAEIRSKDLLNNSQNFYLAISFLPHLKDISGAAQAGSDEVLGKYRDLLDLVAGAALKFMSDKGTDANGPNLVSGQEVLTQINSLMPEIESQLPTRAPSLRRKLAQYEKILPRDQEPEFDQQIQMLEGKSGKELVDTAAAAPPPIKESLLARALAKASEQGDLETARNLVEIHGDDYPQLKEFLSQLEGDFAIKNIHEGRYGEAKKALSQLVSDEEKAALLCKFATGAHDQNDDKSARGFLDEASAIMGEKMRTNKQLFAQITIARGYRELEPTRSFEITEAAISRLNQVGLAAQEYYAFTSNDDAGISLAGGPILDLFSPLSPLVNYLAHQDFDRSVELLKRTQIDEVRVRLELDLLLDLLGNEGKREQ